MKIVIMVDKSAGNDTVGSMWTETHIFDPSVSLRDVLEKLKYGNNLDIGYQIKETVKIQIAED